MKRPNGLAAFCSVSSTANRASRPDPASYQMQFLKSVKFEEENENDTFDEDAKQQEYESNKKRMAENRET